MTTPPRNVAVVGAGIVGLSVAWFLQERDVAVTVFDTDDAARGASWGNAGWLAPSLTTPLPEPDVLRYGLRAVLRPSSPVYVPPRLDLATWRFLAGFARHCTSRQWQRGMRAYATVNRMSVRAFDDLADAGAVPRPLAARPFLACFRTTTEASAMLQELTQIERAGQAVRCDYLTGHQVQQAEPAIGGDIGAAILLHGQRYIHPPQFVRSLADSVVARGGKLRERSRITDISTEPQATWLTDSHGDQHRFDGVVLATGALLGRLAREFGVRQPVQAGRGYSFTVSGDQVPQGPIYFPQQRVACTPLHEAPTATTQAMQGNEPEQLLRVAGMMEFRRPDEPLDPRRIRAIVDAVREHLPGVRLDQRRDEWVGSRPCTTDGLPLVGPTKDPRVFAAGGHGMWGVALGPLTGKLLAEQIMTGLAPPALLPFNPLR
ncbi:amino acid dehydrogenase [Nocardioides sp. Root190]|uniref:NAD(P)/FAD-dependent oxidoreductase n=1 Tax=Nocardioides sp. Root190 TaxID=1736488 RepID=UPI000701BED3|nr:FAD-dependent oxidoreductase [Nocardioides sp. Root190]KRB73154.1 amino acid dehydrogenase [Nocardioides sp. Root190]